MWNVLLVLLAGCQTGKTVIDGDSGSEEETPGYTEVQLSNVRGVLDEEYGTLLTITWDQAADATVWVEYSVDEGVWMASPPKAVSAGPAEQLLLGLPYEHDVTFRIVNDFGGGPLYSEDYEDNTYLFPDDFPEPLMVEGDSSKWDPDVSYVLLSLGTLGQGGAFVFIVDRQGRTVWARRSPPQTTSMHPRVSHDGTQLLIDENTFWAIFDAGKASRVQRMYIDGTIDETISTPGLRHAFTELPDRSLAWPATQKGSGPTNELIQIRSPDGDTETVFDCLEFLQAHNFRSYCGANTLWYDVQTDHFLYSLFTAETVVEVDRQTGEALRHFGHIEGAWGFSPEDSAFWWQHGAYYTEAGTLLVSSEAYQNASETVVREYALNEETETLEEVWSFGEGQGVWGSQMGEAHRLPSGNTLHNYGTEARLREVTADGEVVWDIDWDAEMMGRSTGIADLYALLPAP